MIIQIDEVNCNVGQIDQERIRIRSNFGQIFYQVRISLHFPDSVNFSRVELFKTALFSHVHVFHSSQTKF